MGGWDEWHDGWHDVACRSEKKYVCSRTLCGTGVSTDPPLTTKTRTKTTTTTTTKTTTTTNGK